MTKREEKECEHCGEMFQRSVSVSGFVESPSRFKKRRFCGLSCNNTSRNLIRWNKPEERA